jgi:hypothetical protein
MAPQVFLFYANDFDNPVTTDWAAPTLAPAAADTIRSAITVRLFDATQEEGVGFYLTIPSGSVNMTLEPRARPQNAPSPGARVVGNRLYYRQIPGGIGPTSTWSQRQLNNMTMPSGVTSYSYKPAETIPLAGGGGFSPGVSPGTLYGFEFTRTTPTPGASNLPSDWNLVELIVTFT